MKRIWIIFLKEVVDNLRDRRSVMSAVVTPIIIPVFLVAMIVVMGQTILVDPQERPVTLPVAGAERAPGLVAFLQQNNVIVQAAPADPEQAVRNGDVDAVLIIPDDYGEKFAQGRPAPLRLVMDSSRQSAMRAIQAAGNLLDQYGRVLGALRLQARGINPEVITPLSIASVDLATPQSQAVIFLNMMPFLIIMSIFLGGMYVVIDATAGERERGSLEPLLINPACRSEFAIGKLLSSLPFAVATLIISLVTFWLAFNIFPLEEFIKIPMQLDPVTLQAIFWLSLPMVLLASALQMLIASYTRSFKEAQTYLSFLPMVAGFPSAFLAFLPVKASLTTMLIPTFGQSILINQMLRGEQIVAANFWIVSAVTMALAFVVIGISIWLYRREQILFGR